MKAQTKALLASIVVIALALTAVSGVTYSWFSDTEKAEIDVSTAKIDIEGVYSELSVKKTSDLTPVSDTTAAASTDNKTISINSFLANRTVSATYTLTNKSTVDTTYRMYVSVSGLTDALAKQMISITAVSGNGLTLNILEFNNGIAYVVGGAGAGISLDKATGSGTEYKFSMSIVSDTAVTSIPDFTIEIVNEAYQTDYTYSAAQVIRAGSASFPTAAASSDITFKGTVPVASGATGAKEAEAEIVFSQGAANTATTNGTKDVALKTEMLDPDGSIAKIRLTLEGTGAVSNFGTDYVTVNLVIPGEYTDIQVVFTGSGDQPILLGCVYDLASASTKITFRTNHFSEFEIVQSAVAIAETQNGTKAYSNLKDAVEDAKSGGTVTLVSDASIDDYLTITGSLTLDLNGFTIASAKGLAKPADNQTSVPTIVIKNGNVTQKGWLFRNYYSADANLVIENILLNGGNGVLYYANSNDSNDSISIKGSDFRCDSFGVWIGAKALTSFNMSDSSVSVKAGITDKDRNIGVILGTVKTGNITGSTISVLPGVKASDIGGGLEIKSGAVVVNECTITGYGYLMTADTTDGTNGGAVAPIMVNNAYAGIVGTDVSVTIDDKTAAAIAGPSVDGEKITIVSTNGINKSITVTWNGNESYAIGMQDGAEGQIIYNQSKVSKVSSQDELNAAINAGDCIVLLEAGSFNLPSLTGKSVTFIGSGDATVIDMKEKVLEKAKSLVFKNLKYEAGTSDYKGFQHTSTLTYEDCTITGKSFLYATEVSFKDCIFVQDAVDYSIWTYGAGTVDFTDCTFECKGKAVLIYNEGSITAQTVNFKDCTFNASQSASGKAAIEIDCRFTSYTVNVNNCSQTGFDYGSKSGNQLWNVKDGNKPVTITVNGTEVYPTV